MLAGMERASRPIRSVKRRDDGAATKLQILEAAGAVFAEKGFGRTKAKEIAERAKTNSAAVNYYFGGIDGLYAEVLVEAHHRLIAYEFLKQVSDAPGDPRKKLDTFIDCMFRAVLGPASSTWPLRVLGREMLTPSPAFPSLLAREVLPKKQLAIRLIAEILGVSPDHPAVARCGLGVIAPFALLVMGHPQMLAQAAPTEDFADTDTVIRHFQTFIAGGLAAIAAEIGRS
jgi:AcrR family transcriptional regulator